jgi:hypothetical protein
LVHALSFAFLVIFFGGAFSGAAAVTAAVLTFVIGNSAFVAGYVFISAAVADYIAFIAVGLSIAAVYLWDRADGRNHTGRFWVALLSCLLIVAYLSLAFNAWLNAGMWSPILVLVFVLIPLVNIPFDWLSVGLTRALLRRGCEPGAWLPLWLGLIDFGFGLILLLLLAAALIVALQAADAILIHFHRDPAANVVALLDNIRDEPRDPANYWAYVTLFSTLVPSVLNAVIGAFSLVTWWLPEQRLWALAQLDILDRRDKGIRVRVAALLGAQACAGTVLLALALWLLWQALLEVPLVRPGIVKAAIWFAELLQPPIT